MTMARDYEARTLEAFYGFLEKGFVYRGLKPVYWCIHDRTALAEAEVEYEQHTSPSIYVRYKLTSAPEALDPALAGRDVYTIIWTTTPWTIPASMAVAFHPDFEYVALAANGDPKPPARTADPSTSSPPNSPPSRHRSLQTRRHHRTRPLQRHTARALHLQASLPRPQHPRRPRHLRHRRPGHRRRPHRPFARRRRLLHRPAATTLTRPAASTPPDALHADPAGWPLAAPPLRRQDRLASQSHRSSPCSKSSAPCSPSATSSTPIPTAGAATTPSSSAPPSSGSSPLRPR